MIITFAIYSQFIAFVYNVDHIFKLIAVTFISYNDNTQQLSYIINLTVFSNINVNQLVSWMFNCVPGHI